MGLQNRRRPIGRQPYQQIRIVCQDILKRAFLPFAPLCQLISDDPAEFIMTTPVCEQKEELACDKGMARVAAVDP
jgi:hypothetical protein